MNAAVLNKTTGVLSEVTEILANVVQLLNNGQAALITITERNVDFSNISSMVDRALDNANMKYNDSQSFLLARMMDEITVNNISRQLEVLQTILEDKHLQLLNVSLTINNTINYNRDLDINITRLQVLL